MLLGQKVRFWEEIARTHEHSWKWKYIGHSLASRREERRHRTLVELLGTKQIRPNQPKHATRRPEGTFVDVGAACFQPCLWMLLTSASLSPIIIYLFVIIIRVCACFSGMGPGTINCRRWNKVSQFLRTYSTSKKQLDGHQCEKCLSNTKTCTKQLLNSKDWQG